MLEEDNFTQIEKDLWEAADQLRANSKLNASEYSMPILGLIFLRYAYNRFLVAEKEIIASLPQRKGWVTPPVTSINFLARNAIYLPEKARYDYLASLTTADNIGAAVNEAMELIENENKDLKGVLPKEYTKLEDKLLFDILRIFNRDSIKNIQGDAFGKIYEYFLNEFAMTGAQEGGEFFTPSSLVNTIVNVIKPVKGNILDPACGSAGMFVQTGYFIKNKNDKTNKVVFYGQEKTETNTKLAKMNLAVHGLEGKIALTNTFYDDSFNLAGKCDFVMANPPFNVNGVEKERDFVKNDPRLLSTFDAGGSLVKLIPKSDNANYLWIQYFYGYLNPTGRAGFVMASSASDAGYSEKDIRTKIVNTGAVDVMIAIGTNFFYTRSLPCTLWFFDRSKENDPVKKDYTLMLDARSIYRKVTKKVNDFSPEQLKNIILIVDLYRGENEKFNKLVNEYLNEALINFASVKDALSNSLHLIVDFCSIFSSQITWNFETVKKVLDGEMKELRNRILLFEKKIFNPSNEVSVKSIQQLLESYLTSDKNILAFIESTNSEVKHINEATGKAFKSFQELIDNLVARGLRDLNKSEYKILLKEIENSNEIAFNYLKQGEYFLVQVRWLYKHFPEGVYNDYPGLCKKVSLEEISKNEFSLTPGRYVGVTPVTVDDFDFTERMREIKTELESLNEQAAELSKKIFSDLEELGI
ncbi:MAG: N-6 DNA methylase [Ignavibacteriaceae bacterium]|nr:N-6 DNA methylase [Ignavibacteriaceae bacterium]